MTTAEERQLLDAELEQEVGQALDASGLPPSGAPRLIAAFRERRLILYKRVPPQRGDVLRYQHDGEEVVLEQMTLLSNEEADSLSR